MQKTDSKKRKNDIIFIAALILMVTLLALALFLFKEEGVAVIVRVDGEVFGEYSLSEDREVEILTEQGRNLLVIKEGKAEIIEASCPDGICEKHRAVSRDGESIICLPNKVVVEIAASYSSDGEATPDIIA
ncbi:MAG: NusG domain II-containing protein [Clostridia bacterium]|nr:NusG domain II-containing protein [Clostridia bacterium]